MDSPVRDLGDVSRAYHVGKYLEKTTRLCKSKKVVIHDYGAGNWLYLGEILRVLKLFKQQKFILVGNDFSQEALDFGIEKYRKRFRPMLRFKQDRVILPSIYTILRLVRLIS